MSALRQTTSTLVIERLAVRRGGRTVIDNVSLTVGAGEIVGVVGKNGCGKSTLLSCVAGVLAPREGRVTRRRRRLGRAARARAGPPRARLRARGRRSARLPARRRAAVPLRGRPRRRPALRRAARRPRPRRAARRRARADVARPAAPRLPRRCVLGPPKLLVLDEPDNGLDAKRLDALVALIRDHAAGGGSCLLASHDAALLDQLGARVRDA